MSVRLIVLLTLLSGCAPSPAEVQPYLDQFIKDSVTYNVSIDSSKLVIQFKKLTWPMVGQCSKDDSGNPLVTLDPGYWVEESDPSSRQELVYHELGHCLLGRGHVVGRESIMNAVLITGAILEGNKDDLLKDLFTNPD